MILILMTSRSGSSLVAKIFAAHGFDAGEEKVFSCGYETFENAAVNRWIDKTKPKMRKSTGVPCQYIPGVEELVTENSLVKTAMEYAGVFENLQPKIVLVKRNVESIIASVTAKRGEGKKRISASSIQMRMLGMERMRQEKGGAWVDTDALVAGDMSSIRAAFEYHGIAFDEDKARACVERDKWSH